jgi:hypothetical protein
LIAAVRGMTLVLKRCRRDGPVVGASGGEGDDGGCGGGNDCEGGEAVEMALSGMTGSPPGWAPCPNPAG